VAIPPTRETFGRSREQENGPPNKKTNLNGSSTEWYAEVS